MWTQEDRAVAACHSVEGDDPLRWQVGLDELMARVGGRFGRVEPRRRVRAFLLGLMAGLPRVNCWTIAEHAGHASPDGMQHLLAGSVWDSERVRDELRSYVVDHLGDAGAVLVVDETGHVKKGVHTVGCNVSTPAPRAGSRTPRSGSTSSTPLLPGTRSSTGRCICPGHGPSCRSAARLPASRPTWVSRRSRPWRG